MSVAAGTCASRYAQTAHEYMEWRDEEKKKEKNI